MNRQQRRRAEREERRRATREVLLALGAVEDPTLCGPDCPFRNGEQPTGPIEQRVEPTDPCFCGSGKALRSCHGHGDEPMVHMVFPI